MWNQSLHRQNAPVPITSRIEYSHASNPILVALSGNISKDRRPYPAGSRPPHQPDHRIQVRKRKMKHSASLRPKSPVTQWSSIFNSWNFCTQNLPLKFILFITCTDYLNSRPCIYAHHTIITHRRML